MEIITAIVTQKNDPSRISIFIDGNFFIGISDIGFSKLDLHVGDKISDQRKTEIVSFAENDSAMDFIIKSCGRSRQTGFSISQKLEKKGFSGTAIRNAIQRAEELNLIDDREYVRLFAADKIKIKNWGNKRIKIELIKKGISSEIIDSEFEKMTDLQPDFSEIKRIVLKKTSPITDQANYQKAVRFLQYRGFSWNEIQTILRHDENNS